MKDQACIFGFDGFADRGLGVAPVNEVGRRYEPKIARVERCSFNVVKQS